MTDPLQLPGSIPPIRPVGPVGPAAPASDPTAKDFKTLLLDNLNEVNRLQSEADKQVQRLITGETDNVAEVFMAVNKSSIAFDLLMEVRNKLVEAYDEIKQMRV